MNRGFFLCMSEEFNGYELSRDWFDFCFDNPEKIRPIHTAIYFFAVEHCNRLGWKQKFGFPSQMVMEAIGVKNWRTYSKGLSEVVDFGFIQMIETSKNQYSSNIIAIAKNTKAPTKALDKALQKHSTKHSQSTVSIDKQLNKEQLNKEHLMSEASASDVSFKNQKYFDIAKAFYVCFQNNASNLGVKWTTLDRAKADKFINPVRLLIEQDKRTEQELIEVGEFLQKNEFWMKNIQSTEKLRKQFDKLITQSKNGQQDQHTPTW